MIPPTNHDFQWGRSEVVIIYPVSCHFNLPYSAIRMSLPLLQYWSLAIWQKLISSFCDAILTDEYIFKYPRSE